MHALDKRLSDEGRARLAAARRTAAGIEAVAELAELLRDDAGGRWHLAGELSRRLRRFENEAYKEIRTGYREPTDRLETLLAAVCASSLPRSRERLYRLLD